VTLLTRRSALLAASALLPSCHRREDAPVLVVEPGAEIATRGVAALVVGSLADDTRDFVAERLEAIADAIEARSNPLLLDFEEIDLEHATREARPAILPMLTAARRLASTPFPLDASRSVRLSPSCPVSGRCVPAWGASTDPEAARVRLAAWPVAHGLWLRADSAPSAREASSSLRSLTGAAGARVALVVGRASLVTPADSLPRTVLAAGRCLRLLDQRTDIVALLRPLADGGPPALDTLSLGETDVLVVPTLGHLAEPDETRRVVRERLQTSGLWRKVRVRSDL
jgi:hypothetical protein